MQDLYVQIMDAMNVWREEANKAAKGNKSAGVRSRNKGQELRELLKQWRKVSKAKA